MAENPKNPKSAFYLHPKEDPKAQIIPKTLKNKQHFYRWSHKLILALTAKNKIGFIDGTITKPSINDDPNLQFHFNRCDSMVQSWIFNSIDPKFHKIIPQNLNSAKELYDYVRKNLSIPRNVRIYQVLRDLRDLKQGKMSVEMYAEKFEELYDELDSFYEEKKPECYKSGCRCEKVEKYEEERWAELKVFYFLVGLDGRFGDVRYSILLMEELPPLGRVYRIVLEEEARQEFDQKMRGLRSNCN